MTKTEIWLIRHGETEWNAQRRLQGWIDIPLNQTGKEQALSVRRYVQQQQLQVDHIISSDLLRASQTALLAFEMDEADLLCLPSLRERHYGIYEGELWQNLTATNSNQPAAINLREPTQTIPEGESLSLFHDRIITAFNQLADQFPNKKLAVIAHGGVIDMVWRHLNGVDLFSQRPHPIVNASVNHFAIDTSHHWHEIAWAQHSHLDLSLDDVSI